MNGALLRAVGTTHCLAIDRRRLAGQAGEQMRGPAHKAGLEVFWIECRKHPAKGVVSRNSLRQINVVPQSG